MTADTQYTSAAADREYAAATGKHLTFELDGEVYGIGILSVREIIGMIGITRMPRTPEYVRGVINLRGKVIPVVDLRTKFGMNRAEDSRETCIIVVEIDAGGDERVLMGILVDRVREVLDIAADDVEDPPELGEGIDTEYIKGMAKTGEMVTILLDIDGVLTGREIAELQRTRTG